MIFKGEYRLRKKEFVDAKIHVNERRNLCLLRNKVSLCVNGERSAVAHSDNGSSVVTFPNGGNA